ncbi:glycosyl transferase family protein [Aurantiacibacter sediminis]|uniref:Glycosyl transferase family protein n=1 Tax=Aurantiacibacter sediminis TaxID=2793064 RepID=A0ABS0N6E1_9SPHN|nr:glycosyl transferase family protein [Aurantiacibacter sediminis]MBH5323392.1 glycosyl transferase family protein [Aurantiacibacter sediminis]
MDLGEWSVLEWLALAEYELLLFAGVFFLLGALDEIAMDFAWAWLRLRGKIRTHSVSRADLRHRELSGRIAVFIPAWDEARVIGHMLGHTLHAWKQRDLVFYVGCYRNDPATLQAAIKAASRDSRVRLVVHDKDGPSTKADCLNRLYRAMLQDEERRNQPIRSVLLHDAEDLVDPAALALIDRTLDNADFVQLPVLPIPQPSSRWIGSHYCEEFAEAHGKAMAVRDALGTGLPAAGVGCAFSRNILDLMARDNDDKSPFSDQSLTEDYEMGLRVAEFGGRSRFMRVRGEDGQLIATRSYFPSSIARAVRQKSRWIHGIAFQGWDRLGWENSLAENWMRLRDRRGPFSALVLFAGYSLLLLSGGLALLDLAGFGNAWELSPLLYGLLLANMLAFAWRIVMRFSFTTREYGFAEGFRAVLRIPVSNIIAIMAGRRALMAYSRTLRGQSPQWEVTDHTYHPAQASGSDELAEQAS